MYIIAPRCWSYKEDSFNDFSGHSIFTFELFSGVLGTTIFQNLSSVASNT